MNWLTLVALTIGTSAALYPQRLYNQAQDTRATAAKTTATALSSNAAFDNAITNTSELFKKQQESFVRDARALMTRRLAGWSTWRDVSETCEEIAGDLGLNDADHAKSKQTAFDDELKKVGEAQEALNEQIKTLQDTITRAGQAVGDVKMAGEWLARLGQLAPTADLILQLKGATPSDESVNVLKATQTAIAGLATLYSNFSTGVPAKPGQLFLQMRLDLLEAEEKTILRKMEIEARRLRELKPSQVLIAQIRNDLKTVNLDESIAKTIDDRTAAAIATPTDPAKASLERAAQVVYRAVAFAARGQLAQDLADSRGWLEDRAHSLRQSQVVANVYQNLLLNGAERLSAYYKGGVRPQTIADLIQAAAAVGLIPAVLTR